MESRPIKKTSTVDLVCERIQKAIQDGIWQIGERLPAESEMASAFGVNRLTVRMALQKLNTLGITETRTGSGTYVVPFDFSDHIYEISEFYTEPKLLDDVCEFRNALEVECARLAMERRTEEELEKLERLLETYDEQLARFTKTQSKENWQRCADADLAFHEQIVAMSHNKLFAYAFAVARESIYQSISYLNHHRVEHIEAQNNYDSIHTRIFEGIRDGDFEKCKEAYITMITHQVEY